MWRPEEDSLILSLPHLLEAASLLKLGLMFFSYAESQQASVILPSLLWLCTCVSCDLNSYPSTFNDDTIPEACPLLYFYMTRD